MLEIRKVYNEYCIDFHGKRGSITLVEFAASTPYKIVIDTFNLISKDIDLIKSYHDTIPLRQKNPPKAVESSNTLF